MFFFPIGFILSRLVLFLFVFSFSFSLMSYSLRRVFNGRRRGKLLYSPQDILRKLHWEPASRNRVSRGRNETHICITEIGAGIWKEKEKLKIWRRLFFLYVWQRTFFFDSATSWRKISFWRDVDAKDVTNPLEYFGTSCPANSCGY